MSHRRKLIFQLAAFFAFSMAFSRLAVVQAAGFTPGDLVVYRAGAAGNTGLTKTGDPVFIDEYTPGGALVQSVEMPTSTIGSQYELLADGQATSEGGLTVSPNAKYIAITGYGAASPDGTTSLPNTAVPRVVGIVNVATGASDTSTAPADYALGNNPRSAVTTDGNSIWMTGAAGGVRYATLGTQGAGSTSTQIGGTPSNVRQVNIFAGQLYASGASSMTALLDAMGTGLPYTSGQSANPVPGFPTTTDSAHLNPYSFFFAELNPSDHLAADTLYVADDTTHPSPTLAGGITKYSYSTVSNTWVSNGSVDETSSNYRGLTGVVNISNGNYTVTLYSTREGGSTAAGGGQIVTISDSSGFNGAFNDTAAGAPTVLDTAATNEAFRGIGVISVTGMPGDFNLDGHVDAADVVAMEEALANPSAYEAANNLSTYQMLAIGDLNHDGRVTTADLQTLQLDLKNGGGLLVPEPAALQLAVLGFVGMCLVGVLRRRKLAATLGQ
ncbi:MAG TPA: dockerin type I repeat-containing protein [Pirellulales bacterium]|nr:dockerin type I repeat-containing protein [Pirellulales bacterium]